MALAVRRWHLLARSLVTPDYLRVFRIDYDGIAGLCGDGVTSHVSLHLTQTAADFANQQSPCHGGCI